MTLYLLFDQLNVYFTGIFITNIIAFSDFFYLLAIFCISPNRNQNNVHNLEKYMIHIETNQSQFLNFLQYLGMKFRLYACSNALQIARFIFLFHLLFVFEVKPPLVFIPCRSFLTQGDIYIKSRAAQYMYSRQLAKL